MTFNAQVRRAVLLAKVAEVWVVNGEQTTGSLASHVGRGLGWSTAGNITLRIGSVLISILMARLIAPDEFGVFAVALTVWSVVGTLAEFGLGTDLIRAKDLDRRIPTVATVGLLTSSSFALVMILAAGPIAGVFQSADAAGVIRLMGVSLVVFGFSIVPAALLQREFRQRALFVINGCGLIASAVTMTLVGLLNGGPAALAWGQVINQLVVVILMYVVTGTRLRLGFNPVIARESAAFCMPLALANLLSWVLLSVDNLIVARVMSPTELGLYVLAFNVSSWPMSAIGQSLRVVALPAFSRVEPAGLRNRALVSSSAPVWAVAVLLGVGLSTLARPLITWMYGEDWVDGAVALSGLGAFGALRVIFDLIVTYLIAVGRSRSVLVVQIWWLSVMLPAMAWGVSRFGLAGAGWTHVAVGVIAVLPAYLVCLHREGVDCAALRQGMDRADAEHRSDGRRVLVARRSCPSSAYGSGPRRVCRRDPLRSPTCPVVAPTDHTAHHYCLHPAFGADSCMIAINKRRRSRRSDPGVVNLEPQCHPIHGPTVRTPPLASNNGRVSPARSARRSVSAA